jgi:4-hydroxy-tetrahydrodipicolinate reductase
VPGVAVFGISGRMGQCLVRALREPPAAEALVLCGALASSSSRRLGLDAAEVGPPTGVLVTSDARTALAGAAVAVDFSLPEGVGAHLEACRSARVPLLVGSTGLDAATRASLAAAAQDIALLVAPNTSVGVAVLTHLVGVAAAAVGEGFDAEIHEAHHRMKRDAPSGTALAWGESIARARGVALDGVAVYDRHSAGVRKPGSIGFSALRAGDIVGEHTATLAADGERIELTHRATDRMVFARGALRAARWLIGRPPGLYGMADVLGLAGA